MPQQEHRRRKTSFSTLPVLALALLAPSAGAQDSAFLDCARFEDRGQRIACLEDALDAATETRAPAPAAPVARPASPPRDLPAAPPPRDNIADTSSPAATGADEDPSLMERIRNFGRGEQASIDVAEDGSEELHDTITGLEKRRNLWIVTLSSGQVWMQEIPRRLNLREGDEIRIYQAGMGNGYRLAAKRLSGFIRVERVK